jgi:hypothetical protein
MMRNKGYESYMENIDRMLLEKQDNDSRKTIFV